MSFSDLSVSDSFATPLFDPIYLRSAKKRAETDPSSKAAAQRTNPCYRLLRRMRTATPLSRQESKPVEQSPVRVPSQDTCAESEPSELSSSPGSISSFDEQLHEPLNDSCDNSEPIKAKVEVEYSQKTEESDRYDYSLEPDNDTKRILDEIDKIFNKSTKAPRMECKTKT